MRSSGLCVATLGAGWALVAAMLLASAFCRPAYGVVFSIGNNFTDGNLASSGFIPPDTDGTVGPNHVGVLINGLWAVYNKTGGAPLQSKSLNQFWTDAGAAPSGSFAFDPRVLYDKVNDRWFATSLDNAGGVNNFLVAVSTGNDPTGSWSGFKIPANPSTSTHWADFDTVGMNSQAVVVAANMFPVSSGSVNTDCLVLPKTDLLAGSVANRTLFENINANNTGYSIQPIVDRDNGNLPLPLLSAYNKPAGSLKSSNIVGPANSPTLTTAGGFVGVAPLSGPPTIDQPGPKTNIDAGDARLGSSVVLKNGVMWSVEGVNVNGRAAIEWDKINPTTLTVTQSGLISDLVLAFNYPSIAVNDSGDVVVGFSGGSPNTYMSTYVAVGETIGGVTTIGSPYQTKAGLSDYQRLDGGGRNRWGDYSATVVDPLLDGHFWTFQEFASATDQWSVQVTEVVIAPEPGMLGLLGTSLVGLLVCAWRRKRGAWRR